ncbi:MAG: hypothetical protein ACPL1H_10655, partial [bacterium]
KGLGNNLTEHNVSIIAQASQDAITGVLVKKTIALARDKHIKRIAISGGVAANSQLREMFMAYKDEFDIFIPSVKLCTDNGSMVAFLGYQLLKLGIKHNMDIDAYANNTRIPQRTRSTST